MILIIKICTVHCHNKKDLHTFAALITAGQAPTTEPGVAWLFLDYSSITSTTDTPYRI